LFGGWSLSQSNLILRLIGVAFAGTALPLALRVLIGLYACRFFVELRRNGAMELLFSTPLTAKEIFEGQWFALRRIYSFPVLAVLGLQLLAIVLGVSGNGAAGTFGATRSWWAFLYGAPSFVPDLLVAAWIGMLVGLTARKIALAPGLTLLYAIVLPGLGSLLCVPSLFIDIPLIFWARDKLYRELRELGSARYGPTGSTPYPRSANLILSHRS